MVVGIALMQKGEPMTRQAQLNRIDMVKDTVTGTATAKSYNVPAMQGWICPVCGRGVSPYTAVCPCKNGKGWQGTS